MSEGQYKSFMKYPVLLSVLKSLQEQYILIHDNLATVAAVSHVSSLTISSPLHSCYLQEIFPMGLEVNHKN